VLGKMICFSINFSMGKISNLSARKNFGKNFTFLCNTSVLHG